jgi:hypothetical protein
MEGVAKSRSIVASAIEVQLPAGPVTVVSRAMLIRMKRLAGRAQDLADIEKLEGARD